MTDPDPLAALAALADQVEQLRGRLARAEGEVGGLRERYEDETGPAMLALTQAKRMREELDEAIEKNRLKPPPAPWWPADPAESRAMMAALAEWVDTFLRSNYPGYLARIPKCWSFHNDAAWEFATVRAEWVRIYGDEENRDLAGALNWHDRLLPGVLGRLAEVIKCIPPRCEARRRQA